MTSNLDKIANLVEFYKQRFVDLSDETKLLQIENWSKITPKRLEKYICDGYIVDWIDGYDVGPSPLTDALMQDASPEIIAILIAAGANVNAPTVLEDGKEMTPLRIVRSQAPTHENVQKELMLLRAGATDDVWEWLQNDDTYPVDYWKGIKYLGIWRGYLNEYAYKVFKPIPVNPDDMSSEHYIVEQMGKISWAADTDADEGDIFYDPDSWGYVNSKEYSNEAIVHNEIGNAFAAQFLAKVEELSFSVAMYEYYTYLWSIDMGDGLKDKRLADAAHDFQRRHFSYENWNELIADTPNPIAKNQYNKMKKELFPGMG